MRSTIVLSLVTVVAALTSCSPAVEVVSTLPDPSIGSALLVGDYPFVSKNQDTSALNPCDPKMMAGYRTASPLARSIAENGTWNLNDETAALALIDSFEHSPNHAFYSAVLLRSISKADGYYAEPLGIVLYEDLLKRPCSLLSCCWENGCDGHEGLLLWTDAIAMEILIEHEEDTWEAFLKYGNQVEAKATAECDLQTRSRAHEFLHEIGSHLKHALFRDSIDASR